MLKNLKLFVTIIEKGGIAAAGREMGLSPATVSERLTSLERYYGVALLTRTTRSISLTEEGRVLLDGARFLLIEENDLNHRIKFGSQEITGLIRLSAPVDLGIRIISPLLKQFMEEHPAVTIDLNLDDAYVDLVGNGFDFGLRYGTLTDSTLRSIPLRMTRRVVCAAPSYLQRFGIPEHPDDLQKHNCLVMRFGQKKDLGWVFDIEGAPYRVQLAGHLLTNNGLLARLWCQQGLGLALKSLYDVQDDLNQGIIQQVLGSFDSPSYNLQLVYPSNCAQPKRVRELINLISSRIKYL